MVPVAVRSQEDHGLVETEKLTCTVKGSELSPLYVDLHRVRSRDIPTLEKIIELRRANEKVAGAGKVSLLRAVTGRKRCFPRLVRYGQFKYRHILQAVELDVLTQEVEVTRVGLERHDPSLVTNEPSAE